MNKHLFSLLRQAADITPERVAYKEVDGQLTYAELNARAEAVGSLIAQRVDACSPIALLVDARSAQCVCAMMGVLAAGCFYAPLDPALPEERLRLILDNLRPALIIADEKSMDKAACACPQAPCLSIAEALQTLVNHALLQARGCAIKDEDLSMVLYTSGSTGLPKGVAHTQQGMMLWTETTIGKYGFTQDTVFANISPYYYANSLLELFVPMMLGAKVVMIPSSYLTFPKRLIRCLEEEAVTELCMTPSSFVVVANSGALVDNVLPQLSMFIMSGEVMPKQQLKRWMKAAPHAVAMNFYGSTETLSVAVDPVACAEVEGVIPVGRLLPGVALRLVTDEGEAAPSGVMGEIYIHSPMIAAGYYRDEERTHAAFTADPLGLDKEIWFKTGDYGVLDASGVLSVMGRKDTMIKHRGYRMELGEVEAAAHQVPGCLEACCLLDAQSDEIWCFVAGNVEVVEIAAFLKTKLAKYMIPDYYIIMPEMPHNAHMKIDRVGLRQLMRQTSKEYPPGLS